MTDTSTAIALLPTTSEKQTWSPQQKALMESLGLSGTKNVQRNGQWTKETFEAPASIVEAFIHQIHRTGLDPVARQIYCIERGGKWGVQISIDGFRLIAERSNEYRGQTPPQWTDGKLYSVPLREDGKLVRDNAGQPIMVEDFRWLDVWTQPGPPAAARVGIYRDGFAEPMWAVATYEGYVARDRNGNPTGQWETNPANQTAKCAEMLGLRKTFPQELSGLYGTEEMDQAGNVRGSAPARARASQPAVVEPKQPSRDYAAEAEKITDLIELTALANEAQRLGELALPIGLAGDNDDGSPFTVFQVLKARKDALDAVKPEPIVDVEPERPKPRQWVREARDKKTADEVRALYREAEAAGASPEVLRDVEAIEVSLSEPSEADLAKAPAWAPTTDTAEDGWTVASIPSDGVVDAEVVENDEEPF